MNTMSDRGNYLQRLAASLLLLPLLLGNAAAQQPPPPAPPGGTSAVPVEQPLPATGSETGAASGSSSAPTVDPVTGEVLVRASFADAPIDRVLTYLAQQSGKTVAARGKTSVGQRVTLISRPIPLERALDMIVNQKPNWLVYKPEDQPNTYEIWDQESFRAEVLPKQVRQKYFIPREITAEDAHKAITGVLTPNIGSAAFDPRSNKLFVTDLPYVLELVQRLLDQIDVKFMTRVFYIRNANVADMAERLSNLKSPSSPAPEVDERTHLIIVRDRLDIIRQMELLIETLDVGPEMRVYDLNNVGFEGQDLADLEDAVNEVITEGAFIRLNPLAGKMILEDVEEVHEKIEKILQAFDQPPKQVLVQGEIIETELKEGFNYGIDYTISEDLFSSVIDGLTGRTTGVAAAVAGNVPTSTRSGATVDNQTLGFLNFRDEFPIASFGGSGVDAQYLTRHAYVRLRSAMNDSRTRILQQPRILVKNQEIADFSVGQKIPFFTGGSYGYSTTNNNGQLVNTAGQPMQNLLQVGLDLSVSPSINNNGLIEMEIEIRNNTPLIVDRVFNGQTYTGVGSNNQELATVLVIPSGETRVIGGLITDAKSDSRSGVPGLIKIPVIGPMLFGNYSRPADDNRRRNLLIFITPTIVQEKPRDLFKYKGRVIVDEAAIEEFPVPPATNTDMQCDPAPLDLPVDQLTAPLPEKIGPVSVTAPAVTAQPYEQETAIERPVEDNGMSSLLPPAETGPEEATPISRDGLSPLRRVKVEEEALPPGMEPFVARGPSGALTGTTATVTRPTGPTVAPPRVTTAVPGGRPTPPSGATAAPTPPQPIVSSGGGVIGGPPSGATPPPSAPTPPRAETRY